MFKNRKEAGQLLAKKFGEDILSYCDLVIIALPRGGVPVASELAKELRLPLDIFSVKKIGTPNNPELALGAVTEEGEYFLNDEIVKHFNLKEHKLNTLIEKFHQEALSQARKLRGNRLPYVIKNKNVVLVDDGIATGATIKAAIELLRKHKVRSIILAVPICPTQTLNELMDLVDVPLVISTPTHLNSIGFHYEDFTQVSDEYVYETLNMQEPVLDFVENF